MEHISHSFRHAEVDLNQPNLVEQYQEIKNIIRDVTDQDLIDRHESFMTLDNTGGQKSLSKAINELLKERFIAMDWTPEALIFQDDNYQDGRWRLGLAKKNISIEVTFNHGEAIAWHLIKPVLAAESNHVHKAIQTQVGVVITATQRMKEAGGFDGSVGTYEKFIEHLPPLQNLLTVPILIIGLQQPKSFRLEHKKLHGKKYGVVIPLV